MDAIKVLIVEDNLMIADRNREFTESVPGFEVVQVTHTGLEALGYLEAHNVDLVVLDVALTDLHGLDFVKTLRRRKSPVDFILMTEAPDSGMIEESMRFGIFDYIIKPFEAARYKESLLGYKWRRESLDSARDPGREVETGDAGAAGAAKIKTKGINPETMRKVRLVAETLKSGFSIDQVSSALSISRITAHRYLESLALSGLLKKEFRYRKVGRPMAIYSLPRRD